MSGCLRRWSLSISAALAPSFSVSTFCLVSLFSTYPLSCLPFCRDTQLAQAMFTLLERKDTKDLLDPAKVGLIAGSARPLADAVYSGLLPPDNNDASRTDSSFIAGQDRLTARLATSRLQQALSPLLRAPHRTGGDDTCRRRLELGRASLRAARAAMLGASAGEVRRVPGRWADNTHTHTHHVISPKAMRLSHLVSPPALASPPSRP